MSAKLLIYVQSLWGIGHLSRASAIASACCDAGFEVTLVNGGSPVPGIVEDRVRLVQLPPLRAADESYSKLVTLSGVEIDDRLRELRRKELLATLAIEPGVVITETWPFGRRKLAFELVPFIAEARRDHPRPLILSSIRDILVPPKLRERAREAIARAKTEFDAVLVHGDERIIRLDESYPRARELRDQLCYTGYVLRSPRMTTPRSERFDVIVSAGGGRSGSAVLNAALSASRSTDGALRWLILSGPQVGAAARAAIPANVTIASHRPDLAELLREARVSVSQAGYNTVLEALSAGCRPVLVPFLREGECEQLQRAERFAALGLATILLPEALDRLAAVINEALSSPLPSPPSIKMDGARETVRTICKILDKGRP